MTYAERWYTDDPNEAEPDERRICDGCGRRVEESETMHDAPAADGGRLYVCGDCMYDLLSEEGDE